MIGRNSGLGVWKKFKVGSVLGLLGEGRVMWYVDLQAPEYLSHLVLEGFNQLVAQAYGL